MRDVAVMTSSRADFGLLCPVMKGIDAAPDLRLRVIASGSHLVREFGSTVDEVLKAGFAVDERVEMLLASDTPAGICKSMGLAMIGFGEALRRLSPQVLVLLGDRFETLCAAAAAQIHCIPIAHIHGGERSEGAVDEAFRHAITKMSHLHFASCDIYRRRIIQLGERPEHVFNVGALGVENVRKAQLMSRAELAKALPLPADQPFLLVTFHSVTLERATAADQFAQLLAALEAFPDHATVFTKANADTDGRIINEMSERYVAGQAGRAVVVASLGAHVYLSALQHADAVVGNSSSGIIEAPALRVPTVNIGDRQRGRVCAPSVIHCAPVSAAIVDAIQSALSPSFRASIQGMKHPCERPDTAAIVVGHLRAAPLDDILRKPFVDLPIAQG